MKEVRKVLYFWQPLRQHSGKSPLINHQKKKLRKPICSLTLALLVGLTAFAQKHAGQTDQVILKLKKELPASGKICGKQRLIGNSKIDRVNEEFHAIAIRRQSMGKKARHYFYIIKFPKGTDIQQVLDSYHKTGEIKYAEPDFEGSGGGTEGIAPNDQDYHIQWSLKNDGTFSAYPAVAGADIDMEDAWGIETGDSNVIVGIIDGGIKLNHPEFSGRIWTNYGEIPNNGIDDDNNGLTDDVNGWNFSYDNNDPTDDEGHGTNVAGIIGANANNAIGYAGVDWNCKLMILKGTDSAGHGYYSWWASAIYYAVDNGAKVINMSLAGSSSSTTLQDAIDYAFANHVTVVVAMGNDNSGTPVYPAICDHVIAVGATNPDDTRVNPFFWSATSGSNYGSHISVVAPGNFIYGPDYLSNTNYSTYWGGTSQAAPHVTGLVALLLAQDPTRTPMQIKSIIEATAEDQVGDAGEDTPGWDQYYGHGRINAFQALSLSTGVHAPVVESSAVLFFPNPFSTRAILQTRQFLHNATLTVDDVFAHTVKQISNISGQSVTVQRDNLPGGLYFIRLTEGHTIIATKKIVVVD